MDWNDCEQHLALKLPFLTHIGTASHLPVSVHLTVALSLPARFISYPGKHLYMAVLL